MKTKKLKLIGLTGPNGAGKGEAAKYFIRKSYEYFSLSDEIREELKRNGLEINRDNLIKKGNELREKFGPDILARRVMNKIKDKAVIDSIRNPAEIEYFRKFKDFILICIDAPVLIRFQRIMKRGRKESVENLYEFIRKEQEEMTNKESAQQLLTCMKMADYTVINDGTIEELHGKLGKILENFKEE